MPRKGENPVAVSSKAISSTTPSRVIFLHILGFPNVEMGKIDITNWKGNSPDHWDHELESLVSERFSSAHDIVSLKLMRLSSACFPF